MSIFGANTLVNFIVYKQNKSSNHINEHKTAKLFTINYPFSLFYIYIHNDQVQIIRLSVTFYRNLNMI